MRGFAGAGGVRTAALERLSGLRGQDPRVLALDVAQRGVTRLAGVELRTVLTPGGKVHSHYVRGRGPLPPAVMVPGLIGDAGGLVPMMLLLRACFRQLSSVDLVGRGDSPMSVDTAGILEDRYRKLVAFVESFAEPIFLVGTSLGGALTLRLVAEHPELVCGFASVTCPGAPVTPKEKEALFDRFDIGTRRQTKALLNQSFEPRRSLIRFLAGGMIERLTEELGSARTQQLLAELWAAELSPALLGSISVPGLVICGQHDEVMPASSFNAFQRVLPPNVTVRLEAIGHLAHHERPRRLARMLADYAERIAGVGQVSGGDGWEPAPANTRRVPRILPGSIRLRMRAQS